MEKIILITGSSRGIGAATAVKAAKQGYHVCVNYIHNSDAAEKVVEKIKSEGVKAIAVQADVSKEAEVLRLFKTIDNELGTLTALVNNTGILHEKGKINTIDTERLEKIFKTNVFSYFFCAREAIKRFSKSNGGNGGVIVNISSIAARLGSGGEYIDYAATKGAIDSFTIGLAKEVVKDGIRVNAVRPGVIDTDIHKTSGQPNKVQEVKKSLPMERAGLPLEVANAVLWLLSDEASYVTGTFLDVSGGR